LHAAFDFTFLLNRWRAGSFLRSIERWDTALGEGAWPNYVLNNHDNPRSATRYTHGENDERLKVAAALLLTQRGTPFLYYGEEIGMRDIHISRDMIQDPVGKKYWPFYVGRDGCRAPMQWSADKNAGFGAGTPWLPPHPDHVRRNVEQMRQTPDSLLYFYRKLIQLRKQYPALREGMFQTLTFDPRWMMAYLRQTKDQTILVALNFSHRPMRLVLGGALLRHDWTLLLSNRHSERPHFRAGTLPLLGFEALIMAQND
jgi:alpha-glucosidase